MTPSRDSTDPTPDPREQRIRTVLSVLADWGSRVSVADRPRLATYVVDALGPMVPLARAQGLERERDAYIARLDEVNVARQKNEVRAILAEEAARDFAAFLRRVEDFSNDSWLALEATAVLLGHPGFLPDTAQDTKPDSRPTG